MDLICYGCGDRFDVSKFRPIENRESFNKPEGGLWASPVDSSWGWIDWCHAEEYRECVQANSFRFTLADDANVMVIDDLEDLRKLPWIRSEFERLHEFRTLRGINFWALLTSGVQAIHLTVEGQERTRYSEPSLYGWDCESVLVMDPGIVQPVPPRS